MAWLDETEFRSFHVTESATETNDDQITECLDSAIELLAALFGDGIIDEVATGSNTGRKIKAFRRAQRRLAYREWLQFMSSRSRDGGIIESERDANGDTVNKYVSYKEITDRRAQLYLDAMEAVQIYAETSVVGDLYADSPVFIESPADTTTACCPATVLTEISQ